MSTATQLTMAQVLAEFNRAQERIKPAILADVPVNGLGLSKYLTENNLAPTAENFYKAINALFASLNWAVKPAKLLAHERESKTTIIPVAPTLDNTFEAKVRAGEKAAADKKEHAALVAQCKSIIEGYNPVTRNGYDARERQDAQAAWTKSLNEAEKKSVEYMRQFTKSLIAARDKRYADRERAAERI